MKITPNKPGPDGKMSNEGRVWIREYDYDSGLKVISWRDGDKNTPPAEKGHMLHVNYQGYLEDGTIFSEIQSETPEQTFKFRLGYGQVIPGWDESFEGMRVCDYRTFIIPPYLAYGDEGSRNGDIPPNSILIFEVNLVGMTGQPGEK